MSLIQEALEKAGKLSRDRETLPPPIHFQNRPEEVQDISAVPVEVKMTPREIKVPLVEIKTPCEEVALPPAQVKGPSGVASAKTKIFILSIGLFLCASFALYWVANSGRPAPVSSKSKVMTSRPLAPSLSSLINPSPKSTPQFAVTGITTAGDGKPIAIVNEQLVGVGDHLKEDAVVVSIIGREVVLNRKGEEITISL